MSLRQRHQKLTEPSPVGQATCPFNVAELFVTLVAGSVWPEQPAKQKSAAKPTTTRTAKERLIFIPPRFKRAMSIT